jgi:hypothetical protein
VLEAALVGDDLTAVRPAPDARGDRPLAQTEGT